MSHTKPSIYIHWFLKSSVGRLDTEINVSYWCVDNYVCNCVLSLKNYYANKGFEVDPSESSIKVNL